MCCLHKCSYELRFEVTQENRRIFTLLNIPVPSTANTETAQTQVLPVWTIAIIAVGGAAALGAILTGIAGGAGRKVNRRELTAVRDQTRVWVTTPMTWNQTNMIR